MRSEAIRFENVRFTYRGSGRPALDGVSFRLLAGESLWLLGPSGAGRSTLARAVSRLVPLHYRGSMEGGIRLRGEPIEGRSISDLAGIVGQVMQDFESQVFGTRVDLEIAFGCENLCVPREEMRRRVPESLEAVGLAGFEARDPTTLSGGEKQRLVIASVLAMRPELLVLDEPTTDLDPVGRRAIWSVLRDIRKAGTTILLVEPDTEEADLADRVGLMHEGRFVAEGKTGDTLARASELERLGIRPPDLAALSEWIGLPYGPGDVDSVETEIARDGLSVDRGRVEALIERDRLGWPAAGSELLRLESVAHEYPTPDGHSPVIEALAGVDLAVREGEFVAILGANGSGKTTLAQIAAGILNPTRGRVLLAGGDLRSLRGPDRGRQVGFVFQNPDHQIFSATVREEVSFAPRNFGASPGEVARAVREALAVVGLEGTEERDPFVMTRGDRQRVAVASVIAAGPRLVIMDEPTTGLDHRDQERMMELLGRISRRGGAVVVVTHAIGLAARWARRLVVLDRGRVVADGETRQVLVSRSLGEASAIRPPRIVGLASRLGVPLVSVEELTRVLVRADGSPVLREGPIR